MAGAAETKTWRMILGAMVNILMHLLPENKINMTSRILQHVVESSDRPEISSWTTLILPLPP
jgi:hypothetical protein